MDTQELVRVYTVRYPAQAEIIRNGLLSEGIACQVDGAMQGGLSSIVEVALLVHASDAPRARAIIERHEEEFAREALRSDAESDSEQQSAESDDADYGDTVADEGPGETEDFPVEIVSARELTGKKCVPCEGGVAKYSAAQAEAQLGQLSGWQLVHDAQRIRKQWEVRDFAAGMRFFQAVADLAEAEGHHPDLHLENYRQLSIELWTHAIGGLSENDFILAAKIDSLPIELATGRKPR